jgi:hypothetical protein
MIMRNLLKILFTGSLAIAGLLCAHASSAQKVTILDTTSASKHVVNSMGKTVAWQRDTSDIGSYAIDFSVGEPMIQTRQIQMPNNLIWYLTEGFIQPGIYTYADQGSKRTLVVYPNPTSSSLTPLYTLDSGVTKVDIRIISITGALMYTGKYVPADPVKVPTPTNFPPIDVSWYEPGVYLLTFFMDRGIKVNAKFVKF